MKKVLLSIESQILASMRQIAKQNGISLSEYINEVLKKIWQDRVENKLNEMKIKKYTR